MRTNNWAFQISRSIYDSEIWMKPPEWLKVWIYLLWRVNFEDNNLFKRWENLFNYQVIAIECWVSYNVVNKCINFLKLAKQVSTQKTTRGVVLAINNYEQYQNLSNYRQNQSKTEAKWKQNESYTITEQCNNVTNKQYIEEFSESFQETYNEWLEYRKSKKKPVSTLAMKKQLTKLKWLWEERAILAINNSIEKDYSWIYESNDIAKKNDWSEILHRMQREWYDPDLMNSYLKITEKKLIERFMKDKEWVNWEFKDKKLEIIEKYGIQINGLDLHNLK